MKSQNTTSNETLNLSWKNAPIKLVPALAFLMLYPLVASLQLSPPTPVEVLVTLVLFAGMVWSGERGSTTLAAWVYLYVLTQAALKTASGTHLSETLPLIFLVLVTFKWAHEKKMVSWQVQGWLALACLARVVFGVMQSQQ